jgi:hypothetical protein|tara:strand:+ start:855 stop:1070 length:216 start_codon:yes stop_codon:yes gene_type:complete
MPEQVITAVSPEDAYWRVTVEGLPWAASGFTIASTSAAGISKIYWQSEEARSVEKQTIFGASNSEPFIPSD